MDGILNHGIIGVVVTGTLIVLSLVFSPVSNPPAEDVDREVDRSAICVEIDGLKHQQSLITDRVRQIEKRTKE
jgi:hypothetical protein